MFGWEFKQPIVVWGFHQGFIVAPGKQTPAMLHFSLNCQQPQSCTWFSNPPFAGFVKNYLKKEKIYLVRALVVIIGDT